MKLQFSPAEEAFRREAAAWLGQQLAGRFSTLRGCSSLTAMPQERKDWERALGVARWSAIGWPAAYGGRDASLAEQVIFAEEYARAGAPPRLGHFGVELAGPTLLAMGSEAQKERYLPAIAQGAEVWCQGYSEPGAGSDLANVRTRARLEVGPQGSHWIIEGQKTWTSLAQFSDWCFLLARTQQGSRASQGLSYLLVPMRQPGVTVKPIRQLTGESEFNEVFFDGARTSADNIVGAEGEGWKVAMVTLAFERGVSTLAQQMQFRNELDEIVRIARENGAARDPVMRQRLAQAHIELKIMRYSALRMLANAQCGRLQPEAYTYKLYWSTWHRALGELAMDVVGPVAEIGEAAPCEGGQEGLGPCLRGDDGRKSMPLNALSKLFLYTRADTIYAGTSEIQRNIIAERALGLPKEARGDVR